MVSSTENGEKVRAAAESASRANVTRRRGGLGFEELLSDLSASFIRVSVEEIDSEIDRWLEQIVFAMEVDRGTVAQFEPIEGALPVTHEWSQESVGAPDQGSDVRLRFPWTATRLLSGELVADHVCSTHSSRQNRQE
jgi:hypothetical protein